MASSFSGGFTVLEDFKSTSDSTDDWSGGATVTGYSTAASVIRQAAANAGPSIVTNATQHRQSSGAGAQTTGILNATVFSTKDMSAARRVLVAHYKFISASSMIVSGRVDTIDNGGMTVSWYSGSGYSNYVRFPHLGSDADPLPYWYVTHISEPGYTTGSLATGGTFDNTDVQRVAFHTKAPVANGQSAFCSQVGYADPYLMTGTTITDPMGDLLTKSYDTDDVILVERLGATQYLVSCALTWGSGDTTTTDVDLTDNTSIFWPTTPTSDKSGFFVSNGHIGFEINGGRNDNYSGMTAALFITFPQPQYFRLVYGDSVANTGSLSFSGWNITGAHEVVIHEEFSLASFTFNDGAAVDLTDGAVTLTGTTSINGGTGASQALINDFTNVGDLNFTNTNDTSSNTCIIAGDNTTRTENPNPIYTDGTEDWVIEYTGTGTLTINQPSAGVTLSSTGGSPNCRATGGGTITIASSDQTIIKDDNAKDGTRVRIVGSSTGQIETFIVSGGAGWSKTYDAVTHYVAAENVYIYQWYDNEAAGGSTANEVEYKYFASSFPSSGNATIDITATAFIDKSTEYQAWAITTPDSDLGSDYAQIEVEYSGVGETMNTAHIPKFISMEMGSNSSADGITNWFTANGPIIDVIDSSNVRIDMSVAVLDIANTGTGQLLFNTDGPRLFTSDGSTLLDSSGGPTIEMQAPYTYQVETGVSGLTVGESAQLASITSVDSKVDTLTTLQRAGRRLNRSTGKFEYYDSDNSTKLYEANAYEDSDATTAVSDSSTKIDRVDYAGTP